MTIGERFVCAVTIGLLVTASAASEQLPVSAALEAGERSQSIRELRRGAGDLSGLPESSVDYPTEGSIFPPEMLAPTFLWHDPTPADHWLVEVFFRGEPDGLSFLVPAQAPPRGEVDPRCVSEANADYRPTPYQASARAFKPAPAAWETIKKHSVTAPATLTFLGYRAGDPGKLLSHGRLTLSTSADPVGAPIFYRDVPLMPSKNKEGFIKPLAKGAVPLIEWRLRDLSLPESRLLLTDMPTCANCHSFSADGETMGMDVDGPDGDKGAYAIVPVEEQLVIGAERVITWNAFPGKRRGLNTLGFLASISPDGRYAVATVNEAVYVRNFKDFEFSQVFYPTRGILAFYSRETGKVEALPGADDPRYVHCDPVWTPDGKTIVFARARARDPYDRGRPPATYAGDPNETPIRYDLYHMPFNEGRGGTAEPLLGASGNGMSNTFPKVSPDGDWIVFVQCANGQLMRPDSKLWILPARGGQARQMNCNLPLMNSWHSFSPNGRWLVFSSKSHSPFTQMFLTHIDALGNDSPAVLIENSTAANRAVNLPEFLNASYDDLVSISVPAVDHYQPFHRGNELARSGRYREAIVEYENALEGERQDWRVNDWRIHANLGKALMRIGEYDRARDHIGQSLGINPYNPEAHSNMAYIVAEKGELERALKHLDVPVSLAPGDPRSWYNRGTLLLQLGRFDPAIEDYTQAIRLDEDYTEAYNGRGNAFRAGGRLTEALADFERAIESSPGEHAGWYFRALIRKETGDLNGARDDLTRALRIAPPGSTQFEEIAKLLRQVRAELGD